MARKRPSLGKGLAEKAARALEKNKSRTEREIEKATGGRRKK